MTASEGRIRTIMMALVKRAGLLVLVLVSVGAGFLLHAALTPDGAMSSMVQDGSEQAPTEWTCAMHTHIRSAKPGRCPVCSMDLIPVTRAGGETSLREFSTSESAKALMEIETARVERRFVSAYIRMVGKVDYDETKLAHISAWVPGRLDRLYVDYTGVPVSKGDHLVSVYSPQLLSAQEELIQAMQAAQGLQQGDSSMLREATEATYQAAREKLGLLGLTPEQIASLEQSGKTSDHLTINSPVAGIVIQKNATEGMYVSTGTRIYTVADLSRMWIRLDAYESDLMWLRYGQTVEFAAVSYPGEMFRGTISFIDPVLDPATRTVKVRVNVPNADGKLKPGMFVKAVARSEVAAGGKVMDADLAGRWISPMHPEIVKDAPGECDVCGMPLVRTESLGYVSVDPTKAERPLVIPATAPLVTGTRAVVYVEVPGTEKPTYEGREIVLGPRAGDYYLVRAGLSEGEIVVTRGNFKIDSALQISAKPSMMSPGGGGSSGEHAHHGDPPASPGAGSEMALPRLFAHGVHQVLGAATETGETISAGRPTGEIQSAFRKVGDLLKQVDAQGLQGHPAMVWREYAMRLSNDAVEGEQATTPPDIARVAKSLRDDAAALRAKLQLSHRTPESLAPAADARFLAQLRTVYQAYFAAQEALVRDDPKAASNAAKEALDALTQVDMRLVAGDDHIAWMKAEGALKEILGDLAVAETLEGARQIFALYSEQMSALATRFGSTIGGDMYQIQCPMAFDNRGAIWLQAHSGVRNPYFGNVMLKCGEVQDVIVPREPPAHGEAHDHE
jgi:membrane fusion protein, copper/silver efflux system